MVITVQLRHIYNILLYCYSSYKIGLTIAITLLIITKQSVLSYRFRFIATQHSVDLTEALRYKVKIMGLPIEGPPVFF